MTVQQVYLQGKKILEEAANEAAAFDAFCLFSHMFGMDRTALAMHRDEPADAEKAQAYLNGIAQRAQGRPLQYILGEWSFMDFTLRVGEGVLIPREETELLVYTAAKELAGRPAPLHIVDLCGGTGAVALGIASLLPNANLISVELEEAAWNYLQKNLANSKHNKVRAKRLDVLAPESAALFQNLDAIVSNPPYIRSSELPVLQAEVQKEPAAALDGGTDGLLFYRAIAKNWISCLKPGGLLAVEIGEEQAQDISEIFERYGLTDIQVLKDFNGLDRVVYGFTACEGEFSV